MRKQFSNNTETERAVFILHCIFSCDSVDICQKYVQFCNTTTKNKIPTYLLACAKNSE